jgi:hypothetical protein
MPLTCGGQGVSLGPDDRTCGRLPDLGPLVETLAWRELPQFPSSQERT